MRDRVKTFFGNTGSSGCDASHWKIRQSRSEAKVANPRTGDQVDISTKYSTICAIAGTKRRMKSTGIEAICSGADDSSKDVWAFLHHFAVLRYRVHQVHGASIYASEGHKS